MKTRKPLLYSANFDGEAQHAYWERLIIGWSLTTDSEERGTVINYIFISYEKFADPDEGNRVVMDSQFHEYHLIDAFLYLDHVYYIPMPDEKTKYEFLHRVVSEFNGLDIFICSRGEADIKFGRVHFRVRESTGSPRVELLVEEIQSAIIHATEKYDE